MNSDKHPHDRTEEHTYTQAFTGSPSWENLQLSIPNQLSNPALESFVQCVLIELTEGTLTAEYVSRGTSEAERLLFVADDDRGDWFRQYTYTDRYGMEKRRCPRAEVRSTLLSLLGQESKHDIHQGSNGQDFFHLTLDELQWEAEFL
ncbi:hypothetical protein [Halopenitus persicus]|uniref:DUF8030 domain-containing protein n=1 Tax=Halopenitus persicus TaxID=1048396 RepID=A0A1H3NXC1_9EURY|nr:hypothetical protein [Halopenitus persicus]SDY93491.1 hypothetical protein SAMN05216564_11626 [Halopenitus persicus]